MFRPEEQRGAASAIIAGERVYEAKGLALEFPSGFEVEADQRTQKPFTGLYGAKQGHSRGRRDDRWRQAV